MGGFGLATIMTVTNQKGGVGKTTTAAALLYALYERGQRVLGVDLDPQGSLSFSLGLDTENCATVYDLFKDRVTVDEAITNSRGIDLLPANILLSAAELEFNRTGREFMLRNKLMGVAERYDYVIIDTPPALNVLTVNAYVASDTLVIPMVPEILSLLGVAQIKETIDTVQSCYNPKLRVLGILLNKYNARLTLNREVSEMADQIAKQLKTSVFKSVIRSSIAVAEAPAHGESVLSYAPNSKPADDFQHLTSEITSLLQERQGTR